MTLASFASIKTNIVNEETGFVRTICCSPKVNLNRLTDVGTYIKTGEAPCIGRATVAQRLQGGQIVTIGIPDFHVEVVPGVGRFLSGHIPVVAQVCRNNGLPRRPCAGDGDSLIQGIVGVVVTAQPSGVAARMGPESTDDRSSSKGPVN